MTRQRRSSQPADEPRADHPRPVHPRGAAGRRRARPASCRCCSCASASPASASRARSPRAGPDAERSARPARQNVQGEEQKKLDVVANEILLETFDYGGLVTLAASEEMEEPVVYATAPREGRYAVLFDPHGRLLQHRRQRHARHDLLDPAAAATAARRTSCARATSRSPPATSSSARPSCSSTPPATACTSSRSTPSIGEFLLTRREPADARARPRLRRQRGPRAHAGRRGCAPSSNHLKKPDAATGRPYATRYSASLVGDVHRFLLEGGIYLYPADAAGGKATRASCASSTNAIRWPSSSSRRAAGRRPATRARPRRRPGLAARADPARDREPHGSRALREVRRAADRFGDPEPGGGP